MTTMIQSDAAQMPALYAALALAQASFTAIAKNRSVTIKPREGAAYHFRYADLEAILAACRPALAANGLALIQPVVEADAGPRLLTAITHSSGAALVAETPIPRIGDRDPKQYGAMLTYLRRYMVTSILGVAADDDLDENGNHADLETGAAPAPAPAAPRVARKTAPVPDAAAPEARAAAPAGDVELIGVGERKYLENKAAAGDVDLAALLAEMGGLVLDKLTKADFGAVKAELLKRAGV